MNRRLVFWVTIGVVAAHAALFWLVGSHSPLPKRTYVPPPNFRMKEGEFTLPGSGERVVIQEFTVSTKLDDRARRAADSAQ
jgi:hypothetical protein